MRSVSSSEMLQCLRVPGGLLVPLAFGSLSVFCPSLMSVLVVSHLAVSNSHQVFLLLCFSFVYFEGVARKLRLLLLRAFSLLCRKSALWILMAIINTCEAFGTVIIIESWLRMCCEVHARTPYLTYTPNLLWVCSPCAFGIGSIKSQLKWILSSLINVR